VESKVRRNSEVCNHANANGLSISAVAGTRPVDHVLVDAFTEKLMNFPVYPWSDRRAVRDELPLDGSLAQNWTSVQTWIEPEVISFSMNASTRHGRQDEFRDAISRPCVA